MLPPLHKVDGPIEYVLVEDEVWDRAKIEEEVSGLPDEEKSEHPWYQYHLAETRYDLKQVASYFKEGEKPTVFQLRRLNYNQWRQVEDMARSTETGANDLALMVGLVSVKNGDQTIEIKGPTSKRKCLTDGDFRKLVEVFGYERIQTVGNACRKASGDLTEREKKASD